MKKIALLTTLLTSLTLAITIGETPKEVTLANENGGYLNGTAWNSTMLKDKVHVLFYVDPDEKDTNNALSEALKAEQFDLNKFGIVAIINLAATWMPNFLIESSLKKKQEKYPNAIYVQDKTKHLVKEWELQDDSSEILLFDQTGKLLYHYSGQLPQAEIDKVIKLIKTHTK